MSDDQKPIKGEGGDGAEHINLKVKGQKSRHFLHRTFHNHWTQLSFLIGARPPFGLEMCFLVSDMLREHLSPFYSLFCVDFMSQILGERWRSSCQQLTIKRKTQLKKLMEAYCSRQSLQFDQ
eukprot:2073877-Rhodomonas_salina.2